MKDTIHFTNPFSEANLSRSVPLAVADPVDPRSTACEPITPTQGHFSSTTPTQADFPLSSLLSQLPVPNFLDFPLLAPANLDFLTAAIDLQRSLVQDGIFKQGSQLY